ncbi:MAG: restriction endonuclease [Armatimonadia bacterium]|nr:restriction endonuclease [Armatimonadia bacterium]
MRDTQYTLFRGGVALVTIDDYVFARAVRHHWAVRTAQGTTQKRRGTTDRGSRSQVTGGKQMDGFAQVLRELMERAGVAAEFIHPRRTTLPGYYRATKDWDLLVVVDDQLRAALELKTHVGPSFGNNINNRVEEALGSAEDLWTAFREGALGPCRPWLGYLLMLEDCERSRGPVSVSNQHFDVLPEFDGASYARRYELLCQKLVYERKYDSACFLMSDRSRARCRANYVEPNPQLSARQFIGGLLGHVAPPIG